MSRDTKTGSVRSYKLKDDERQKSLARMRRVKDSEQTGQAFQRKKNEISSRRDRALGVANYGWGLIPFGEVTNGSAWQKEKP